jgi:hypothetical protein
MKEKEVIIEQIYTMLEQQNKSLPKRKWYDIRGRCYNFIMKRKNIRNVIAFAYSRGYIAGKEEMMRSLRTLEEKTQIVIELSTKNEQLLQKNYQSSLDEIDKSWRNRCQICQRSVQAERVRAIRLQQELQSSLHSFNIIYSKLVKFLSSVDLTHDSLLKHLGRIQSAKDKLDSIKEDADRFMIKHQDFLEE